MKTEAMVALMSKSNFVYLGTFQGMEAYKDKKRIALEVAKELGLIFSGVTILTPDQVTDYLDKFRNEGLAKVWTAVEWDAEKNVTRLKSGCEMKDMPTPSAEAKIVADNKAANHGEDDGEEELYLPDDF